MISHLRGILSNIIPPFVCVDVNGVGYLLQASMSTIYSLPPVGDNVFLHTHYIAREDAHLLFGFLSIEECDLFKHIIKINGVGPKVALAILSHVSPQDFVQLLQQESLQRLQKIPGVGPKTAQRIMLDLAGKLLSINKTQVALQVNNTGQAEAIEALIALGYKSKEAQLAISKVNADIITPSEIIRAALKSMAK